MVVVCTHRPINLHADINLEFQNPYPYVHKNYVWLVLPVPVWEPPWIIMGRSVWSELVVGMVGRSAASGKFRQARGEGLDGREGIYGEQEGGLEKGAGEECIEI
eukprot:gene25581-biopygen10702